MLTSTALNALAASADPQKFVNDDDQSIASAGDVQIWPDTASEDDDYDPGSYPGCPGSLSACHFYDVDSATLKELLVNMAPGTTEQGGQPEKATRSWSDLTRTCSDVSQSTAGQPEMVTLTWPDLARTCSPASQSAGTLIGSSWNAESSYVSVKSTEDWGSHHDANSNEGSVCAVDTGSSETFAGSAEFSNDAWELSEDEAVWPRNHPRDADERTSTNDSWGSNEESEIDKFDETATEDGHHLMSRKSATTLMVRNLPETVTQGRFIEELRKTGFDNLFDFCYVPTRSFKYHQGVGFAFVNFVTPEAATVFMNRWHKSRRFSMRSGASWLNVSCARVQGKDANMTEAGSSRMIRIRNRNYKPFCVDLSDADPVEIDRALRQLVKRKDDDQDRKWYDDHEESWKPVGTTTSDGGSSRPWRRAAWQRSCDTNRH